MNKNSLFSFKDIRNKPHRSGFDLSKRVLFTSKVGELLPVYCKPTLPGDKWHINLQSFTRTQTVQSSAFTRIKEHLDFFFVPYHLLWRNFQDSFTQISNSSNFAQSPYADVQISDKLPYINQRTLFTEVINGKTLSLTDEVGLNNLSQALKLLAYLGYSDLTQFSQDYIEKNKQAVINSNVQDVNVSLMPLLAYQKVYYDFYRNDQWEDNNPSAFNVDYLTNVTDLSTQLISGRHLTESGMLTLHYANFAKDLFTGLLPKAQFGDASVVSSSINGTASVNVSGGTTSLSLTTDSGSELKTNVVSPALSHQGTPFYPLGTEMQNDTLAIQGSVRASGNVDVSKLSSDFTILQLRQSQALQKWKEITQCGDYNYRSQVEKHFGVKLPELMAHRCQFIGGSQGVVSINEVVNQNLIADNEAEIKGKGVGSINDGNFNYECKEHGLIIGIYYAIPYVDYKVSGTSRDLITINIADLPIPEFDKLGFEPFSVDELFYKQGGYYSGFVGYAPRYYNYKTDIDEVKGAFAVSLPNWVAQYDKDYVPLGYASNASLLPALKVRPSILDDIFGVNAAVDKTGIQINTDQLLNCVNFEVHAVRNLDYNGVPY